MTNKEEIPEEVLEWLEAARADGEFNMLDRENVINLIETLAEGEDSGFDAIDWLQAYSNRYMEALMAMGKRRSKD